MKAPPRLPLICLLLAAVACGRDAPQEAISAPPIAIASVTLMDLEDRIEATGQLIARDRGTISAEVSGRVTEIVTDEGRAVESEGVVLRIDPERRELEVQTARAQLAEARAARKEQRREALRMRELRRERVAAQARMEQAETALQLAQARVDAADARLRGTERALRDSNVRAPFAGLVAERLVSTGEFVKVGQPLFELVSLDPIEVEFRLAEVDSSRVALGQTVDVRVSPFPERVFFATVTFVSPTIDPRTRTLRVKGLISNAQGLLRPGLFARADLGVDRRSGVRMVPEEAVLQRADGAVAFRVIEGDRVERRVLEIGKFVDGKIEVVTGLGEHDVVAIRGQAALVDGSKVSIREYDGTEMTPPVARGGVSKR